VRAASVLGISVLLAAVGCGSGHESRPDVLLITVDTLRADRLGVYGFDGGTSPRIDALAADGVVFERAVAASSRTSPSHASIMTSRYTREHSIGYENGGTRLEGAPALAEVFEEAGWDTAAFVGNPNLRRETGFERGFGVYDDEFPSRELNRAHYERIARDTTERAIRFLDGKPREPLFLWVHYQDPHGPYAPPQEFEGRTRRQPVADEAALPVLSRNDGVGGVPAYQALPGRTLPSEYTSLYADEVAYADHWIGELLDAFEKRSRGRPTVVLLTADHGESLGEGDRWFVHGFGTTPPLAHVPLILRAPGLTPGRREAVVNHVDVMPTLLELAGIDPPQNLSGLALGPWLRGEVPSPDRVVYCDIGSELAAYDGDAFLRLDRLEGAWGSGGIGRGSEPPVWVVYTWSDDGAWRPLPTPEGLGHPIRRRFSEIDAYARQAVPMTRAAIDPADAERLRALGYLED
jgi:arylsulfatase